MPKNFFRQIIVCVAIALAFGLSLSACKEDKSDKAQIETVFDAIESGLETGKQSEVLAHIGDEYRDGRGDRKALAQYLFVLSRRGELTILRNQQDITIEGATAKAKIRALVMQGSGTLIPERADEIKLEVTMVKDGEWRVVRVDRDSAAR